MNKIVQMDKSPFHALFGTGKVQPLGLDHVTVWCHIKGLQCPRSSEEVHLFNSYNTECLYVHLIFVTAIHHH